MRKHLLLVEDTSDDEALVLRALKRAHLDAHVAVVRDGVEALDYLYAKSRYAERDPKDLPAVVLLDLKLPKKDGFEVLRTIRERERTKSLPVVVFTSSGEASDLARSYELGASSYVKKPVDFEAFEKTTQQIGRYWLSLNDPPS